MIGAPHTTVDPVPHGRRRRAGGSHVKQEPRFLQTPTPVGVSAAAPTGDGRRGELVRDGLMTVAETVAFLRVSRSTVYALMEQGRLPYTHICRTRRIPRRAIIDLAAANLKGEFPG